MHIPFWKESVRKRKSNNNVASYTETGKQAGWKRHTNIHIKFRISMLVHVSSVDHKKVVWSFFLFSLHILSGFLFSKNGIH